MAPAGPGGKGKIQGERHSLPKMVLLQSMISPLQSRKPRRGALCHLCPSGRKSIFFPHGGFSSLGRTRTGLMHPQEVNSSSNRESGRFNCLAFHLPHGGAVVTSPCTGQSRAEARRCLPGAPPCAGTWDPEAGPSLPFSEEA